MKVYAILQGKPMADGIVPDYSIIYMTRSIDAVIDKLEAIACNDSFESVDAFTFKFKPSGEYVFIKSIVCHDN